MAVSKEQLIAYLNRSRSIEVDGDTILFSDGTVDSVGLVEMIGFIEKEASILVAQEDVTLENFDTITRILAYLDSLTKSSR